MLSPQRKSLAWILPVLALLLSMLSGCGSEAAVSDSSETAAGIAYLQSLDNQDINEIDSILSWQHEHNLEEMHEERLAQLESGEITCWSLFEDYLLCGDSRSVAFSYNGFLPESNVLAKDGATIRDLQDMLPDIVSAAPARIFLCYGMNDFCAGIWDSPEAWAAEYADTIRDIQAQVPGIRVYVCSIIPATTQLTEEQPLWTRIPDFNAALESAVSTIDDCCFIDLTALGEAHQDLYKEDGKHFVAEFYEYWGTEMIMTAFDAEFDSGDSESDSAGQTAADGTDNTDQTAGSAEETASAEEQG